MSTLAYIIGIQLVLCFIWCINGLAGPWFCHKCWRSVSFNVREGGEIRECKRCGYDHPTHLAEY